MKRVTVDGKSIDVPETTKIKFASPENCLHQHIGSDRDVLYVPFGADLTVDRL